MNDSENIQNNQTDQTTQNTQPNDKKTGHLSLWLLLIALTNALIFALLVLVLVQQRAILKQIAPEVITADSGAGESAESSPRAPMSESDKELYKKQCAEVSYEEFARDSEALKGQYLTLGGRVLQAAEGHYRLGLRDEDGYWGTDVIYMDYDVPEGAPRVLENDFVRVWGESTGFYTYTSVSGERISLPKLNAAIVEASSEEELSAEESPSYTAHEVGQTLKTEDGVAITLRKVLARPQTEEEGGDKTMLFFLVECKNESAESLYFSQSDLTCYVDSFEVDFETLTEDTPEGYEMLSFIYEMSPGYGARGYLAAAVDPDFKTVELGVGGENRFSVSADDLKE